MVCKKCGEELDGEFTFCPKGGKRLDEKMSVRKILWIVSPVVVLGAAIFLYVFIQSRNTSDEAILASTEITE